MLGRPRVAINPDCGPRRCGWQSWRKLKADQGISYLFVPVASVEVRKMTNAHAAKTIKAIRYRK